MDVTTRLAEAILDSKTQLADVIWNGAQATRINWDSVSRLGDEFEARRNADEHGRRKEKYVRLRGYQDAVRTYRQVATVLRAQSLQDNADRFAYRAQVCQRMVLRRQCNYLRYVGSLLLDVTSGYGYRPLRSFITYLLVVGVFAIIYYLLGNNINPSLNPLGAIVFSITSFHRRGFAPGENVQITNPLTVLAAIEAIIGLFIEITFIATFTRRFFAR